jgi:hypothetical protein
MTLQQHLRRYVQHLLLKLAWRRPVPGLCANVYCGKLRGPAVGGVGGRVSSLCGGCRSAWYCSKACQELAWEEHKTACEGCE